jgi:uncharacterized membrane protein (DUF373 family)
MGEKLSKLMNKISELLELVMSVVVLIAIIVAIFSLKDSFIEFCNNSAQSSAFLDFIGTVMNIVIGIEFFKMLCRPQADTVLEVVMFVITRHMILHDTQALENFLTIAGLAIVVLLKTYLYKNGKSGEFFLWKGSRNKNREDEKQE